VVVAGNNSSNLTVGADCYELENEDSDAEEVFAPFFNIHYIEQLSEASRIEELTNLLDLIRLWLPWHAPIYACMLSQCPKAFMRLYSNENIPEGVTGSEEKIFNYIKKTQEYITAKQELEKINQAFHPAKFTSLSARERSLGITWFKRRSAPVELLTALIVLPLMATLIVPAIVFFHAKWTLQKKSNLAVKKRDTVKEKLDAALADVTDKINLVPAESNIKSAVSDMAKIERAAKVEAAKAEAAKAKAKAKAEAVKAEAAKVEAANKAKARVENKAKARPINQAKVKELVVEIAKSFCDEGLVMGDYVKGKFSQWGLEEGHVRAALQLNPPKLCALIQALEISYSTKKRRIEKKYKGRIASDQEGLPDKQQYVDSRMKAYMCYNLRLVEDSEQCVFDETKIESLFKSVPDSWIKYVDSLKNQKEAEAQALAAAGRKQGGQTKTKNDSNDSACFVSSSNSSSDLCSMR
tara:strand:+ start:644 stop:2044 length:1401 start_codon:yes stop_codon:yes gene_type:complete